MFGNGECWHGGATDGKHAFDDHSSMNSSRRRTAYPVLELGLG